MPFLFPLRPGCSTRHRSAVRMLALGLALVPAWSAATDLSFDDALSIAIARAPMLEARQLQVTASREAGARRLSDDECAQLRALWMSPGEGSERIDALVDALSTAPTSPRPESASTRRVREVISALPQRSPLGWTLNAMAAEAALSPSRFAHAFRDQAGTAVRPYLRWLRLARALQAAACGLSLTDAAHEAGFADAAHFIRTMRRHFGVTPGSMLRSLRG